ncbi:oligosaccharide flippase family protein [Flavobacteriaceae bacterium XHP0103]|nr:oligosaccharide flippase family protein [Marixanthotalea marina]
MGTYSIAYSTLILFGLIASLGLNTSILRFIGQFSRPEELFERKRLYFNSLWLIFISSIFLSFFLYIFSEEIAMYVFDDKSYIKALQIVSVMAPFFTLNLINVEYLRGLKKVGLSEIFRTVLIPLLCISVLILFPNINEVQVLIYVLAGVIMSISLASFIYIYIRLKNISKPIIQKLKISDLIKTSIPMMFIALSSYIIQNISIYVIQIVLSTYEVGIFALALKLSLFISVVLIGVNTVLAPKISELFWAKDFEQLSKMISKSTKFICFLSFPLFLILAFFSEPIITFINSEFVSGKYVLVILATGQLINACCGPVGILLNMTGNQYILMKVTLLILVLAIILNFLFVSVFGILGAAYATCLCVALKNILLLVIVKRKLNINIL